LVCTNIIKFIQEYDEFNSLKRTREDEDENNNKRAKISTDYDCIPFDDSMLRSLITEMNQLPTENLTTDDNVLNELECFMTELDQLLSSPSSISSVTILPPLKVNEPETESVRTKIMDIDITKLPQKKLRTRNVRGIYRREHPEGNNMKGNEKKQRSTLKTGSNSGKVNTIKATTQSIPSSESILKLDVACKGGFILLPKIPVPLVNGKLPILPLPSRKSINITPRLLLPK